MKDTLSKILIFTAGAALGSVVTWKLLKTKYDQITREEIESVKEEFSKRNDRIEESEPVEEVNEETTIDSEKTELLKQATNIAIENNYTNYANSKGVDDVSKPYVIAPDEYGELDEYDTVSLTYYSDGVLADDMDEIVEDVDNVVGRESLTHFGEYEDDSVFVRNDERKVDYEILFDTRKYVDAVDKD